MIFIFRLQAQWPTPVTCPLDGSGDMNGSSAICQQGSDRACDPNALVLLRHCQGHLHGESGVTLSLFSLSSSVWGNIHSAEDTSLVTGDEGQG